MNIRFSTVMAISNALIAVGLTAPPTVQAQAPTIIGYPANFDAVNNTGGPTEGFEIEADGIQPSDVTRVFGQIGNTCYIRYCAGKITAIPSGVVIRWESPYDPNKQQFTLSTPVPNGSLATGESCWTLGLGVRYPGAGCEHFGISTTINPTRVIYRWLVADPNNPGTLTYFAGSPVPGAPPPMPPVVPIPQPVINVLPPPVAGGAPIVQFQIDPPVPPPPAFVPPVPQFGDAQWVKVFKLEMPDPVDLNDLMGGNPAVPEAAGQVETPWSLIQFDPGSHSKHKNLQNGGGLGGGSRAVVRRYEHYAYTGAYDPATHAAVCGGDGTCSTPQPGELGDLIGAQNAAANLVVPSVIVSGITKAGGTVTSTDGTIRCPQVCTANYAAGKQLTLTAVPPKGAVFLGWSGACSGSNATCQVTITDVTKVSVNFAPVFALQVSHQNGGLTTATPGGELGTSINCGNNCSANYQADTVVTLTATPIAPAKFTGWSGACSGTQTTCVITMPAAGVKVQANYK